MLQVTKHRELMYNVLRDIFSSEYAVNLAFKGGTLCYFIYSLDRFSTDIDLDLVHPVWDEDIFLQNIGSILNRYGTIKETTRKRSTFFFLLSYGETDMNIKIEINTRIWGANKYELLNFYGVELLAMEKSTIFANKLVATTDRKKVVNRDLYDIYFFFKNMFPINDAVIRERTGKATKEYLKYLLEFLDINVKKKNLLDGLWEVLDSKQKTFVKEKLLDELRGMIQFQIDLR